MAWLVLLMVGACATPSPPEPAQISAMSPWRGRPVAAALAEWRDWGAIVLDGWPESLPAEPDPQLYSKVLQYWDAVPEGPAVIRRHQQTHDALMQGLLEVAAAGEVPLSPPLPALSLWAYPAWSAAFISHVMAQAGVPGFVFPPAAAHAAYVDLLLIRAAEDPPRAAFRPQDPASFAPQPGDLLCADRSILPLLHWQERLAETGQFRPMHCDLVVGNGGGLVQAVGGNVIDVVALRRFPADADGRVLPAPLGKSPFLVVFENRLDLAP
ncbi:DUF2272 domain-containing protein [Teichococcus vastitatis]|uniref:DUF2272 domain-containing protein n=1 Tax=Teichococcus vastitatis TaxID=2307076 RepID=A0ABS9W1W0_9PROT|nr:DUF2272 domain-containing protein [Pseudoroseomonas vastitatis]MCI0752920.1 DUF2272 domain-containing protein [Pseudoroseomonas vastitatis]